MYLTIEFTNEQAAALKAKTAAQGLSLEEWLKKLATQEESAGPPKTVYIRVPHPRKIRPGTLDRRDRREPPGDVPRPEYTFLVYVQPCDVVLQVTGRGGVALSR